MKQLSAVKISDLCARKIDIYATIAIAFAIGLATLIPVETLLNVSASDKFYHLISFAILTLPIAIIRPKAMWLILSLSIAYGGAIEIIQPLVNRNCEMADLFADACGAVLGILGGKLLLGKTRLSAN